MFVFILVCIRSDRYLLVHAWLMVLTLFILFQEHVNEIDFDYIEYARQRFQQYWLTKRLLLASIKDFSEAKHDGKGTV